MEEPKEITQKWLAQNFETVNSITFHKGWDSDKCILCQHEKLQYKKSESWTNTYYCSNCNTYNFVIRADRMGGNWSETVTAYQSKEQV